MMTLSRSVWTDEVLDEHNAYFADRSPREILAWAFDTFGSDVVMATGFGPSGIVLMDLAARLRRDLTVFYLDTDLLFPETYALRDRLAERFGLNFERVPSGLSLEEQEGRHGPALWERNPDHCCRIRKVLPLRRFLKDKQAWITGLRRDQGALRSNTNVIEWDAANRLVKINPIAYWTSEDVWGYIELYDLPYNPLHDQGYPSLGCIPCTRAVAPGEDARAGRWAGRLKTECGIHLQEQLRTTDMWGYWNAPHKKVA